MRFLSQMSSEMLHQMSLISLLADGTFKWLLTSMETRQMFLQSITTSELLATYITRELLHSKMTL
jgi:hypothetical protein